MGPSCIVSEVVIVVLNQYTWICPDESVSVLPPWLIKIQCLEKDEEHSGEERDQKSVQDGVEQ